MEHFFLRVDKLLSDKGFSQRQLCKAIGLAPQAYTNFKFRDSIPTTKYTIKIAQFLGTSVEYLVFGTEPVNSEDKVSKIKRLLSDEVPTTSQCECFWGNVKHLCKAHDVSQEELSVALGWNARTVSNKIYMKTEPTISEAFAIASYFHCSLYTLLNNSEMEHDSAFFKEQIVAIKDIINE